MQVFPIAPVTDSKEKLLQCRDVPFPMPVASLPLPAL